MTLQDAHTKAQARRFAREPEQPSAFAPFGPLLETDSLVERIERIWGLTPRESQPNGGEE